jgi:hypothetical protein
MTVCAACRAALAGLALSLASPLHAAEGELAREPGSVLLMRCTPALQLIAGTDLDPSARADALTCIGFADGFLFGHGWAAWREGRDMYYCPPEQFSGHAAVPVLVDYLRAHPERLDVAGHVLLFAALTDAFPCTPR